MSKRILGLDLGVASVGWALIEESETSETSGNILGGGSRIFPSVLEAKSELPKNAARRLKRAMRRTLNRRQMRRDTLTNVLTRSGLWPESKKDRDQLIVFSPYLFRKTGLDHPLSLFELGRCFLHMNKRRGFLSNRKSKLTGFEDDARILELIQRDEQADAEATPKKAQKNATQEEKDLGAVLGEISQLKAAMQVVGARTLGEYLADLPKKRGTHTERAMYQHEFEQLWTAQQTHHPNTLSEGLKAEVYRALFFQRPLKLQKFLVGPCTLEPQRKRAAKACLEFQEFRTRQELNHLLIFNPDERAYRCLSETEREAIFQHLQTHDQITLGQIRKALSLHAGEHLNFEDKEHKIPGNRTSVKLQKILGTLWQTLGNKQFELITDLLTINDRRDLFKRLESHWKLPLETAYHLTILELESGYSPLSRKAICLLLPHLRTGLPYAQALQQAGYHAGAKPIGEAEVLAPPPRTNNPVVGKALNQTRKIVNALIATWGLPDVIRVELTRDAKQGKKARERIQKQQKVNEKLNNEAKVQLEELGILQITGEALLKYRLWAECKGVCPYTGQTITPAMLFGSEVDIEHILPYSRSLDDSYMNKTLCMSFENRQVKKGLTPFEAYGETDRFPEIRQRLLDLESMPREKKNRFFLKDKPLEDWLAQFTNRQLSDTRYISLEVKNYLQQLGCKIEVTSGSYTAALRRKWSLNNLWRGKKDDIQDAPKSRDDHRHHALDALVTALTDVGLMQRLGKASAKYGHLALDDRQLPLPAPWPDLAEQTEKWLKNIIVSHAPMRKLSGALTEETAYGKGKAWLTKGAKKAKADEPEETELVEVLVHRKSISELKDTEVPKVRDPWLRGLLAARLAEYGGNAKKAFAEPIFHKDGKTPIKKVRLANRFTEGAIFPVSKGHPEGTDYKFYIFGNNHHIEIIEDLATGKRSGGVVTAMEAAKRVRIEKKPMVQTDHGPGKRLVCWLCINDLIRDPKPGYEGIFRVQKMDNQLHVHFRLHTDATLEKNLGAGSFTPGSYRGTKLYIDPLGRIKEARE
ncbi:MAG: type II CRISPR RNA-guided endonuclease Cas9 [Candidatus Lambdaproteobacteria bacterium RIFOXYD2_FULL_50_16]|uniref:CRISPR-associated endonuclease Cas9 n=1 Tax=Candidatus Lambdaproteobacteria bacterium RIFOXYD2_FULL_50_16 TaxID=1817772 RepID=A0A1F6GB10_9PROT|nr:MAG: type II CRISPR RNA-guided endonuclease Cas9 [Candidatus Lambdaproteobacteria bacterium RIFOXYD2_FULL_50_16]